MAKLTIQIPRNLDNTKSGHISETEMATSKWPSISERRSPTETSSNHIHLDRTRMPTNGMAKLTIQIPRNLDNTKSGYISGTEMATLKWPSISERRSPTETSFNHSHLDLTRVPTNGKAKTTVQIPKKLRQHKVGLHLWDRDGDFKVAVYLRETQPDRNVFQSHQFGSYKKAYQWHDQTYDPNFKCGWTIRYPRAVDISSSRLPRWQRIRIVQLRSRLACTPQRKPLDR